MYPKPMALDELNSESKVAVIGPAIRSVAWTWLENGLALMYCRFFSFSFQIFWRKRTEYEIKYARKKGFIDHIEKFVSEVFPKTLKAWRKKRHRVVFDCRRYFGIFANTWILDDSTWFGNDLLRLQIDKAKNYRCFKT